MTDANPKERRPDGSLRQDSGQATGSPLGLVEGTTQALRQAGYRLTQPRLTVLRVLQESNGYLSPAEIYERGRTLYPSLGLVTVYRTLETLEELGLVRRVHGQGSCQAYARANSASGHYLVCHQCGQVTEFPCALPGLSVQWRMKSEE